VDVVGVTGFLLFLFNYFEEVVEDRCWFGGSLLLVERMLIDTLVIWFVEGVE
jgi:hypothetical protein